MTALFHRKTGMGICLIYELPGIYINISRSVSTKALPTRHTALSQQIRNSSEHQTNFGTSASLLSQFPPKKAMIALPCKTFY